MSVTASISFTDAFVYLAADPSQEVRFARRSGGVTSSTVGEVRQYASGRLRAVVRAGSPGQVTVGLRTTDRSLVATLRSWAGQIVCLRDELGRRDFVVYFDVPENDLGLGWVDVDLTCQRVSFDEAV